MRKIEIAMLGIIAVSFIIGIYLYEQMPEQMPSHWNAAGEVDDYLPKFWGLFLMPIISAGLLLLFIVIPKIDPLRENIEKFRKHYDQFILLIIGFLFYIYLLTLAWALGSTFNMNFAIMPAISVILFYAGVLCENAKRNWFIGIRTPWTLSSNKVWNKTNKLGGKLFKACGVIVILGVFIEGWLAFMVIFAPIILSATYVMAYSYFEFKKEMKSKKRK